MPERALTLYQYGPESTRGTAVAATRVVGWDIAPLPNDRVWRGVKYANGRRTDTTKKANDAYLVESSLSMSEGYFQVLPHLVQCCFDGTITPTETTGGQGDYAWTATPLLTAANDPDTITLELADDVQEYEIEYVMFTKLKFSCQIAQDGGASPVKIDVDYFGRQVTESTKTASLVLPTALDVMNGKLSRLYVDTTYAGVGGTEVASILRGWELEILTENHPKFMGSANKYFTSHGEGLVGAILTVDLEGTSAADTLFDLYQAGTERAVQLTLPGATIAAGVASQFRINMWAFISMATPISANSNGNNITRVVFQAIDDGTNFFSMPIITNINAL